MSSRANSFDAKIARTEVGSSLRALKVQRFESEEEFFESMKGNSLSIEYIIFVRGDQVKGLFKFKKEELF